MTQTPGTTPLVLFGGTFDPVHQAHVRGALAVSRALSATVQMLPNALPPHRAQPGASAGDRLTMLSLACRPHPQLSVCDWELQQPGPSWTARTLEHFRRQIGDQALVLVIGADSLAALHEWRDWQRFPALCHLAVLPRPGAARPDSRVLAAFPEGTAVELCATPCGRRLMLPEPELDISATGIRETLASASDSADLDPAVLAHIRRQGLYTGPADGNHPTATDNHNGDA